MKMSYYANVILLLMCSSFTLAYDWDTNPGSGTSSAPWQISTVEQLEAIAGNAEMLDDYFILTADITYATNDPADPLCINHTPIGTEAMPFKGSFDGNGHSISNLYCDADSQWYAGLFGYAQAQTPRTIKNLTLVNPVVKTASRFAGSLVGCIFGGYIIDECVVISCQVSGEADSQELGGLAGLSDARIERCRVSGSVSGLDDSQHLGGLVGFAYGTINRCCADVSVTANGRFCQNLGGLAGYSGASISQCCACGNVTGAVQGDEYLGGLVGQALSGSISQCYATGNVSATEFSYAIGGLIGECYYANVSQCYAAGAVLCHISTMNPGGLVGGYSANNSTITDCFWDVQTSGMTTSTGGTGLTTALMQTRASFVGWDFPVYYGDVADWLIYPDSYPILYWEKLIKVPGVVGLTSDQAIAVLTENKFSSSIRYAFSDLPAGLVLSQVPLGGREWLEGMAVELTLAKPYIVVPDVSGMTRQQAETTLTDAGLTCRIIYENSTVPQEDYIAQSPAGGAWADAGTLVIVSYSAGTQFCNGDGSAENPWQIRTIAELEAIAGNSEMLDDHFILMADVIFESNDPANPRCINHTPIGTQAEPFAGVFDGNGYSIKNLYCDRGSNSYAGLFGYVQGRGSQVCIKNLTIVDPVIHTNADQAGALAGCVMDGVIEDCVVQSCRITGEVGSMLGGLAGNGCNTINRCSVTGVITTGYPINAGGLVGYGNVGMTITRCHADVSIENTYNSIGGLVGYGNGITISQSFALGDINGNDGGSIRGIGGLVGESYGCTISQCYAGGDLAIGYSLGGINVGGLIGICSNNSSITGCYATGNTSGRVYIGGLIGSIETSSSVSQCYSVGSVSAGAGSYYCGGLVGSLYSDCTITDSFWDIETSGMLSSNGGGIGLTTAQMQTLATFTGWDFTFDDGDAPDWLIYPENYPIQAWTKLIAVPNVVGLTSTQAAELLTASKLNSSISYAFSDLPAGQVLSQNPAAGLELLEDMVVSLTAAKTYVIVPDVTGMTIEQAHTALTEAGLTCRIVYENSELDPGSFIAQAPAAGTQADTSSIVQLSYSAGTMFCNGDGTAENPWQIRTVAELEAIAGNSAMLDDHFILTADIFYPTNNPDEPDFINHTPIGTQAAPFTGRFNGNSRSITNLTVYTAAPATLIEAGLFGCVVGDSVGDHIRDLTLVDAVIDTTQGSAGMTEKGFGIVAGMMKYAGISNCTVMGCVISESDSAYNVGSLIGYTYYTTIHQCQADGNLSTKGMSGGLIGYSNHSTISQCFAGGNISGGSYTGGLAGVLSYSTLTDSFAATSVAASSSGGGLVGRCTGTSAAIIRCFSIGSVSGGVAGLVGSVLNGASLSDSYWDIQTSGTTSSNGGGIGLTTAQMQTQASFVGWNFATVWGIHAGTDYPFLRWQRPYNTNPDFVAPTGVGLEDFAYLAQYWLMGDCSYTENDFCHGADLNGSGEVDIDDLIRLVDEWLSGK